MCSLCLRDNDGSEQARKHALTIDVALEKNLPGLAVSVVRLAFSNEVILHVSMRLDRDVRRTSYAFDDRIDDRDLGRRAAHGPTTVAEPVVIPLRSI